MSEVGTFLHPTSPESPEAERGLQATVREGTSYQNGQCLVVRAPGNPEHIRRVPSGKSGLQRPRNSPSSALGPQARALRAKELAKRS